MPPTVSEYDEAVEVELDREHGPAPILVDDGLNPNPTRVWGLEGTRATGTHLPPQAMGRTLGLDLQYPIIINVFCFVCFSSSHPAGWLLCCLYLHRPLVLLL